VKEINVLNVLYVCSFSLKEGSGKGRATSQKLIALQDCVDSLKVVSSPDVKGLFKYIYLPLLEIKSLFFILLHRPDVVISRGFVGCLFQPVANKFGIVTVREVHADVIGEVNLLPFKWVGKMAISLLSRCANRVDRSAQLRIFNHPDLMAWYHKNYDFNILDGFVYNGYDYGSCSSLNRNQALDLFKLDHKYKYLVFVGAASEWHGVEYLVSLQKEFDNNNDGVVVICGGGSIPSWIDVDRILKNISPLDDVGCANLIKAADACLLPDKNYRVSPGSPLKLYDYIVNKSWIVAQENTNGYSDEVKRYGIGIVTNFTDTQRARVDILRFLDSDFSAAKFPSMDLSWGVRMAEWMKLIRHAQEHDCKY
jgi:glycosyltransferase involved in cell wall biosynthesis